MWSIDYSSQMDPPPEDAPPPKPLHELGYHRPPVVVPLTRRAIAAEVVTIVLAVLWPFGAMFAGTASDHVTIPVPKKLALTTSAAIVTALLFNLHGRHRFGCGGLFALVAFWLVAVMWFWN